MKEANNLSTNFPWQIRQNIYEVGKILELRLDHIGHIQSMVGAVDYYLGDGAQQAIGNRLIEYIQAEDHATWLKQRDMAQKKKTTVTFPILRLINPTSLKTDRKIGIGIQEDRLTCQIILCATDDGFYCLLQPSIRYSDHWGNAKERYKTLFDANIDAIAIHRDEIILDINPSFERLFGWTYDEAMGMAHMPYIDLDKQYSVREYLKSSESQPLETLGRNKQGETIPIEISGKHITYDNVEVLFITIRDLRPMRKAQAELREREELFRTMADTTPVLIWRTDTDGQLDYVNRVWLDFTDSTLEDNLGEGWFKNIHPDDCKPVAFMVQSALKERSDFRVEYRLKYHDDTYRWILHQGTARYINKGTFAGFIGSCIDINDRIVAEQDRMKNERRMKAVLNALPDLLFVIDKAGTYTDVHAKEPRELVLPTEEIIGKNIRDLPLTQDIIDQNIKGIEHTLKTGELYTFDYVFMVEDEEHHYSAHMVPLNHQEVLALVRDITPLHSIQDELSQHISDLMVLRQLDDELSDKLDVPYISQIAIDAAFRISNATTGFIAYLDQNKELSALWWLGNHTRDSLKDVLADKQSIWQDCLKDLKPRLQSEIEPGTMRGLLPDSVCMMVIPLISQERIIGLLGLEGTRNKQFTQDTFQFLRLVAGRIASTLDNAQLYHQTENQLQQMQNLYAQVSKLEQIKTDMIRIASHDLRNPLAGMMGYLEMLRWDIDTLLNDQQRNYLDQIDRAARRMQTITTGILSLERIEQLASSTEETLLDMKALVKQVIQEQITYANEKQQILTEDITSESIIINGDSIQLHEAMSNLIHNAIKYTAEQGTIHIKLQIESDVMLFEVSDNGYGIPESQQERIFSPFFRAKMDETKDIEGTGLGLHLVKNIIERHGGMMAFESERGQGSTFGFQLPLISI